jgi:hypothetical protein
VHFSESSRPRTGLNTDAINFYFSWESDPEIKKQKSLLELNINTVLVALGLIAQLKPIQLTISVVLETKYGI